MLYGLMKMNFGMKAIEIHGSFFTLCKRRQKRNKNLLVQILPWNSASVYRFAKETYWQLERQSL